MAKDLNQCNFIGRLGGSVELRHLPNGDPVASFSIAVGDSWKDKTSGEKQESVEWVRIVAWRQLADVCAKYLEKGSQVFISGRLQTRKYKDKDGQDKYTTEIIADRMQMLGGKPAGDKPPKPGEFDGMSDSVPF